MGIGNSKRQRLEKQHTILQSEWNTRIEKVAKLRQALGYEASADRQFELERKIQLEEQEIDRLERELSQIEQNLNGETTSSSSRMISNDEQEYTKKVKPLIAQSCLRTGANEIDEKCRQDLDRVLRDFSISKTQAISIVDSILREYKDADQRIQEFVDEVKRSIEGYIIPGSKHLELRQSRYSAGIPKEMANGLIYSTLAREMLEKGQFRLSAHYFQIAIEKGYREISIYTGLAYSQVILDKHLEAEKTIRNAKKLFRKLGDREREVEELEKFEQQVLGCTVGWQNLG